MEMQEDFKELLALFGKNKVEYIVVGAFALAYHGVPRYTGDLDILINAVPDNAKNIIQALKAFGFGSLKLDPSDFTKKDQVVQLGYPPVRIDIITSITGVSWEEADKGKSVHVIDDLEIFFLGRKELVKNKKETGRKKDLADLEALGEN